MNPIWIACGDCGQPAPSLDLHVCAAKDQAERRASLARVMALLEQHADA